MLGPRLLARLLAHLGREIGADGTQGHQLTLPPIDAGAAAGEDRLARLPAQVVAVADELVDEAHAARLSGADHVAGQHHLHGGDRAGLPDGTAGAAKAGENAEIDLGEAEPRFVVVYCDAVAAGEGQLQPAAEAETVNARDDRDFEVLDP